MTSPGTRFGASWLGVALLGIGLAGCATGPRSALPDPAAMAPHEWEHGPPWGPEEIPWVSPPVVNDSYLYGPYPWYAGGPAIGLGVRRGFWWGGPRGFPGRGFGGRPPGIGHFHGGGRRGGRR
jgi:hypothetical protein